jgi:hypothetical protein
VHSGVGHATAFAAMPRATRAHLEVHDIAELARLYAADAGSDTTAKPRTLSAAQSRR